MDSGWKSPKIMVFEVVHVVAEDIEERHVIINDCVNQKVGEQTRAVLGAVCPLAPEPAPGLDCADGATVNRPRRARRGSARLPSD